MKEINKEEFKKYGMYLEEDTSSIVAFLEEKTAMPNENNLYVAHDEELSKLPIFDIIRRKYYAEAEIETGYCNGYNSKLNCLEWHMCPEINCAAKDLTLMLALLEDIKEGKLDTKKVKLLHLKKGEMILLYPGVLHFSPCKEDETGFKNLVVLTKGTNLDLDEEPLDKMIFKKNKWLLAHQESVQASKGAYIGLIGENLEYRK